MKAGEALRQQGRTLHVCRAEYIRHALCAALPLACVTLPEVGNIRFMGHLRPRKSFDVALPRPSEAGLKVEGNF